MTVSFSPVSVLRIAKYAETAPLGGTVSGCLLGLDSEHGDMEVTNVFLHPAKGAADFQPQQTAEEAAIAAGAEAAAASAAASYQTEAVRLMKASNLDGNIVGWFQSSVLGSYINETTVEIQYDYQSQNPNSVLVIADASSSSCPIKALRLTKEYLAFHRTMRDRQSQGPATLITGGPVSFNTGTMTVFEELPMKLDLSVLDEAFLFENRARLSMVEGSRSCVQQDAAAATVQLLMECVEDLAIEKVRFAQLISGKAPVVGGATRLRGEEELKRLQSANAIILLTENVRLLNEIVEATANSNKTTCQVFDSLRK